MTKAFSVASWNVKNFKSNQARVDRAISFLKKQDADIFALYELSGKDVFLELVNQFSGYSFQITEGKSAQKILIGIRDSLDTFITQKLEYTSGSNFYCPGLLVTVIRDSRIYPLLFMNIDSEPTIQGMGQRNEMMLRAFKYREKLNKLAWEMGDANGRIGLIDMLTAGTASPIGVDPQVLFANINSDGIVKLRHDHY